MGKQKEASQAWCKAMSWRRAFLCVNLKVIERNERNLRVLFSFPWIITQSLKIMPTRCLNTVFN